MFCIRLQQQQLLLTFMKLLGGLLLFHSFDSFTHNRNFVQYSVEHPHNISQSISFFFLYLPLTHLLQLFYLRSLARRNVQWCIRDKMQIHHFNALISIRLLKSNEKWIYCDINKCSWFLVFFFVHLHSKQNRSLIVDAEIFIVRFISIASFVR